MSHQAIGLQRLLTAGLANRALVRVQNPVRLSDISEPEPDLAVVRPRDDDYADAHPIAADVFLIVEVADTTLTFDRSQKAPLYALAGITEYCWSIRPGHVWFLIRASAPRR
jgi:hypothetical protein